METETTPVSSKCVVFTRHIKTSVPQVAVPPLENNQVVLFSRSNMMAFRKGMGSSACEKVFQKPKKYTVGF